MKVQFDKSDPRYHHKVAKYEIEQLIAAVEGEGEMPEGLGGDPAPHLGDRLRRAVKAVRDPAVWDEARPRGERERVEWLEMILRALMALLGMSGGPGPTGRTVARPAAEAPTLDG